jgi:DNA repair exonuclease SbcCD ATPase subunit
MEIKKLTIENFLTIGRAEIELDSRGLLLIQGVNSDDPSAKSNGAGKSSIVDALCWAIYGVTARGVTTDAVVNKVAKKNCCVKVEIEDGAVRYFVTRYRKDSTHKNQVFVEQQTAIGLTDMSKGTDKETQEVINQVMGCSLDVFMASVYCGQEKMPDLPGMTDKQLKLLIEEAAGVEVLSKAYAIARQRSMLRAASLTSIRSSLADLSTKHASYAVKLIEAEGGSAEFEAGRKLRAKTELAKTLPIKEKIAELEASIEDVSKIQAEIDALDEKLKLQKSEEVELRALNASVAASQNEVTRLKTLGINAKAKLTSMESALLKIDERVGTPCGECGKAYHEEDMAAARIAQQASIDKFKPELRDILSKYKDASEAYKIAFNTSEYFQASMTDFSAAVSLQRDLNGRMTTSRMTRSAIESKQKEIESIGIVAKAKLGEPNPWTKSVEAVTTSIKECASDIVKIEALTLEIEAEVALLEAAVKVFGPAGVRAHILDTVTPYLNERTRDYLGALTDGNIHAEWNTLSKTAKGDLKEKFNIEVVNDKGAESFAGLSGGEKRKVRLATAMALQDMVASRATKPINLFLADEIDDALDDAGLERLMTVLERKARERGTVMVISHNALGEWIDEVITVTKKEGLATVTGSTERGF